MRLIHKRGRERIAFPLEEGETYIGRKDYCEIFFPDSSLSKRHARLLRRGRQLVLFDAGSRNGTLLNDELVDEAELQNGDIIQCGKLRFMVDGIPESGSHDEFQLLSGEDVGHSRSRASMSRSRRHSQLSESGLVAAKAVASTDQRASFFDVLPEVPGSLEDGEAFELEEGEDAAPVYEGPVLKLVDGGPAQEWQMTTELMTIGSKQDNDVVISGDGVSRYHAELVKEPAGWVLKDLGARNGLFIAGERIDVHVLQPGDEIQIGTIKLRYEIVKANPMDALGDVFAKLKADPVGTFKSEPRVRMGAAAIVAALILLIMFMPGGKSGIFPGSRSSQAHGPWLPEGSQHMVAGNYKEARDVFRKAKIRVNPAEQSTPRTLERIASQWMTLEKGPAAFRWSKAEELLKKSARLKGLPEELRTWLDAQDTFVETNKAAYEKLTQAAQLADNARAMASSGRLDDILDSFTKAINAHEAIDSKSLFKEEASKTAGELSQEAFKSGLRVVKKRMRSDNPNWTRTAAMIDRVRDYAYTTSERQVVRRLAEECEINRHDEALYVAATKLINTRILSKYPDAQRLLEQIDRRSRIYPDAQAYIDWIEADLKVRHAKRAYDIGDARQAFQMLNEAMRYEVLGPEAKTSVRTRRAAWARVVRAWERGRQLFDEGKSRQAKEEFERVIKLEPNARNRFHVRARDQIKHIIETEAFDLQKKLREGLRALDRGDFRNALRWFAEVRQDPNHRNRDLEKIRLAVAKKNQRSRLLKTAKEHLIRDRSEKFIEIRDVFKLLTIWLPEGHKDRREARKHLKSVIDRLKNWRAGALNRPR